ncbi:hypothetical protein [Paenibacillus kandeliae]|uniref:hypothetical protein n=1 Tax=Paenibacillus kandeliae TaxID=3231269 RepID=UPI0034593E30
MSVSRLGMVILLHKVKPFVGYLEAVRSHWNWCNIGYDFPDQTEYFQNIERVLLFSRSFIVLFFCGMGYCFIWWQNGHKQAAAA